MTNERAHSFFTRALSLILHLPFEKCDSQSQSSQSKSLAVYKWNALVAVTRVVRYGHPYVCVSVCVCTYLTIKSLALSLCVWRSLVLDSKNFLLSKDSLTTIAICMHARA